MASKVWEAFPLTEIFMIVRSQGLHRPGLLTGFEWHRGNPFSGNEVVFEGLGGSDFRAAVAEFGEVLELLEEGAALFSFCLGALPFFHVFGLSVAMNFAVYNNRQDHAGQLVFPSNPLSESGKIF